MSTRQISSGKAWPPMGGIPDAAPEPRRWAPPEDPARARKYMVVSGIRAPLDEGLAESGYDYKQFATLACR